VFVGRGTKLLRGGGSTREIKLLLKASRWCAKTVNGEAKHQVVEKGDWPGFIQTFQPWHCSGEK
jgi:hypothetical protein